MTIFKRPPGPRVNLTLTPEIMADFDRLAELTGAGPSTVIRQMVFASWPELRRLVAAAEAYQSRFDDSLRFAVEAIGQAQARKDQGSLVQAAPPVRVKRASR